MIKGLLTLLAIRGAGLGTITGTMTAFALEVASVVGPALAALSGVAVGLITAYVSLRSNARQVEVSKAATVINGSLGLVEALQEDNKVLRGEAIEMKAQQAESRERIASLEDSVNELKHGLAQCGEREQRMMAAHAELMRKVEGLQRDQGSHAHLQEHEQEPHQPPVPPVGD